MIASLAAHIPGQTLGNEALAELFPEWSADGIFQKTGIRRRPIAAAGECASDLAYGAARVLLSGCDRNAVGFLLFCTQSPDFALPSSACMLQDRLGLPTSCGALDFNLGCSGFVYGLALACGLLARRECTQLLLLTADTYSKMLAPDDKTTRALFGDAGAATLLSIDSGNGLDSFVFGTDGKGAEMLIREVGGFRPVVNSPEGSRLPSRTGSWLRMAGPDIYNFTLRAVPELIEKVCHKAGLRKTEVDYFVFHQANAFMLEALRRKLEIPREKFEVSIENFGNTVSSSIPIALLEGLKAGRIRKGMKVLLAGFGVGLSWAGCILTVQDEIQTPGASLPCRP